MANKKLSATDNQWESMIDRPTGPYKSWDKVNRAMIRHWCDVLGDDLGVYTDEARAQESVHGQVVAPPTMLQAWTMRGYRDQFPPGSDQAEPFNVLSVMGEMGYPAIVAVNCEQEYERYLKEGDEIYHMSRIESVSEEKSTALGVGFFVTELSEYFDQADKKVGQMRFRVFSYRPHENAGTSAKDAAAKSAAAKDNVPAKPRAIQRMHPVRNHDTGFFWQGVDEGKLLIQRCKTCDTLRHPPGPMCPQCQSLEWDSVMSTGKGQVYSYVVMHYPEIPPFDYPNLIALVELEEGTRLITQLIDIRPKDITIGLPVEVEFTEVEEGLVLPLFKPIKS